VFSFIVYKSRAHRDKVNAKVMSDPELRKQMEKGPMPFDLKRMAYGGFKIFVDEI
jgi:alkaline phosphatase